MNQVIEFAEQEGYGVKGLILSPIKGPKGNIEFLVHLQFPSRGGIKIDMLINNVLDAAKQGLIKKGTDKNRKIRVYF